MKNQGVWRIVNKNENEKKESIEKKDKRPINKSEIYKQRNQPKYNTLSIFERLK